MKHSFLFVVFVLFFAACAPAPTPAIVSPAPSVPAKTIAPTQTADAPAPIAATPTQNSALGTPSRVIVIGFDDWSMADIQAKTPNLWAFMQKGAVDATMHHSDLPPRTAPDFASIASGLYPDRHGIVNNSFIANQPRAGFAYWDNVTQRTPPTFTSDPPWVGLNQAGWDVGAIGWQGLAIETKDEASAYLGHDVGNDLDQYWGIAIHRQDGKAQMGMAEIPELRAEFADGWRNGWAGPPRKSASVTLPMATTMLKIGVPFLFVYVENTHGRCSATPQSCQSDIANGTFDDLLQADDAAFGKFFSDLTQMNITPANTLFVFTTDEQDHYLANYAQIVDTTDLQPSIAGSGVGLFYGTDVDTINAALASRKGVQFIATREAIKALHIANGADARTPTIVAFSDADYTFNRGACSTCGRWNHGTVNPDIVSWLALVGPGIKRGATNAYSDHTDIIPTIRAALGIAPATDADGAPIFPALDRATSDDVLLLREAFKQLNAPLGKFGLAILKVSTDGARAGTAARNAADALISQLAARRDALVAEMRPGLDGAKPLTRDQILDLLTRSQALMDEVAR